MKRRTFLHTAGTAGLAGIYGAACTSREIPQKTVTEKKKLFSFVHFSDIHVQPERGAHEGFLAAIEKMNSLSPDFAVSGGDLIMDALGVDEDRAVMLYDMYIDCSQKFDMPVYNVMGNHEIFGIYVPDKVPVDHPDWGKEMFKKRLGNGETYRSFDHKGVHFLLLDSMGIEKKEDKPGFEYYGEIGAEQMEWLKRDIESIPENMPVIAVSHIPLFTLYFQVVNGPMFKNQKSWAITNGKELYELMKSRRLLGYLQGHIHVNEVYTYKKSKFVDTAAVCGGWWSGPRDGHPEGFNLVDVYEDEIQTTYITYGWDASKFEPEEQDTEVFPLCGNIVV